MKKFLINLGFRPYKYGYNGVIPDFFIEDVAFFEIKKYWGISRIVMIDNIFKDGHVVAFITERYYFINHADEMRLKDWMLGVKRPLLLLKNNELFRVFYSKEDKCFEFRPISFEEFYKTFRKEVKP